MRPAYRLLQEPAYKQDTGDYAIDPFILLSNTGNRGLKAGISLECLLRHAITTDGRCIAFVTVHKTVAGILQRDSLG